MGPRRLGVIMAISLAFEGAQLPLLLGKQLFNHRPLARVGLRREQPSIMLYIQPSYILR